MKLGMQDSRQYRLQRRKYLFAESSKFVYPGSKDVKYAVSEQKLEMAHSGRVCVFWLTAWHGWPASGKPIMPISCDHTDCTVVFKQCCKACLLLSVVHMPCISMKSRWRSIKIDRWLLACLEASCFCVFQLRFFFPPVSACPVITNIDYRNGIFMSDTTSL